jgi:hypothetical protein
MGNGAVIDMFSCNGTVSQTFQFLPDGTLRLYAECLTARGGKIVLWSCGAGRQKWTVIRTGGLSSELAVGGSCLALPRLTAAQGTQLVTASCGSGPRVHWHIW